MHRQESCNLCMFELRERLEASSYTIRFVSFDAGLSGALVPPLRRGTTPALALLALLGRRQEHAE